MFECPRLNCDFATDTRAELQRHECLVCITCCVKFLDREHLLEHACIIPLQPPVDNINPTHYRNVGIRCMHNSPIECIDIARNFNFNLGNTIKYVWRCDHKGNRQENLKKAMWYLIDEIRKEEPNFEPDEIA